MQSPLQSPLIHHQCSKHEVLVSAAQGAVQRAVVARATIDIQEAAFREAERDACALLEASGATERDRSSQDAEQADADRALDLDMLQAWHDEFERVHTHACAQLDQDAVDADGVLRQLQETFVEGVTAAVAAPALGLATSCAPGDSHGLMRETIDSGAADTRPASREPVEPILRLTALTAAVSSLLGSTRRAALIAAAQDDDVALFDVLMFDARLKRDVPDVFMKAVEKKSIAVVERLLEPDYVHEVEKQVEPCLVIAAAVSRSTAIVRAILCRASSAASNHSVFLALEAAVLGDDGSIVETLLTHDARCQMFIESLFLVAVNGCHEHALQAIVSHPRVRIAYAYKMQALRFTLSDRDRSESMMLLLLQSQHYSDEDVDTALRWACKDGKEAVVKRLLLHPRYTTSATSLNESHALEEAVSGRSTRIVETLLLDARIDPSSDRNRALQQAEYVSEITLLLADARVFAALCARESLQDAEYNDDMLAKALRVGLDEARCADAKTFTKSMGVVRRVLATPLTSLKIRKCLKPALVAANKARRDLAEHHNARCAGEAWVQCLNAARSDFFMLLLCVALAAQTGTH